MGGGGGEETDGGGLAEEIAGACGDDEGGEDVGGCGGRGAVGKGGHWGCFVGWWYGDAVLEEDWIRLEALGISIGQCTRRFSK